MAVGLYILILTLCFINIFEIYNISSAIEIFRQPIQLLLVFIAIFQAFINKRIRNANKSLIIISLLFFLYLLFQVLLKPNFLINDFSNSLFGLIVFYLFYSTKYDPKSLKQISRYSFVALSILSFLYIYKRIDPSFKSPQAWSLYVNSVYYPLCILPYCLYKKKYALLSIILVLFCSFVSSKQGAFVAIILIALLYYFVNQKQEEKKIGTKFFIPICILGFIGLIAYNDIVSTYNIDIMEGFSTISEDGGSGRMDIYLLVLSKLGVADLTQLLFGHGGINAVANDIGISAHNDFLEIIYDFGLIGFILYLSIIVIIIKNTLRAYKSRRIIANGLIASVIIFLVLSMVSHIMFILKYGLLIFSFWGMGLSLLNQNDYVYKSNSYNCA